MCQSGFVLWEHPHQRAPAALARHSLAATMQEAPAERYVIASSVLCWLLNETYKTLCITLLSGGERSWQMYSSFHTDTSLFLDEA